MENSIRVGKLPEALYMRAAASLMQIDEHIQIAEASLVEEAASDLARAFVDDEILRPQEPSNVIAIQNRIKRLKDARERYIRQLPEEIRKYLTASNNVVQVESKPEVVQVVRDHIQEEVSSEEELHVHGNRNEPIVPRADSPIDRGQEDFVERPAREQVASPDLREEPQELVMRTGFPDTLQKTEKFRMPNDAWMKKCQDILEKDRDPHKFLSNFERMCDSFSIEDKNKIKVLQLCLDEISNVWLTDIKERYPSIAWVNLRNRFLGHFSNPNLMIHWQEAIRNLRMTDGVQRYSDAFLDLAKKLHWSLEDSTTIFQYKQGLTKEIQLALRNTEATAIMTSDRDAKIFNQAVEVNISVITYIKMALSIEANSEVINRSSDVRSFAKSQSMGYTQSRTTTAKAPDSRAESKTLKREKEFVCFNCNKPGHRSFECKLPKRKFEGRTTATRFPPPAEEIVCAKCKKKGHLASNCPDDRAKQPEVRRVHLQAEAIALGHCVETPCLLNDIQIFGLVDPGSNVSLIDKKWAEAAGWAISPVEGHIVQALDKSRQPRIGVCRGVELRNGTNKFKVDLEVADLSQETKLILGMDIFSRLGYSMTGIPFTWPTDPPPPVEKPPVQPDIPVSGGIPDSWRKVIKDNQELEFNSACKWPEAEFSIDTGDANPVYIPQWDIPPGQLPQFNAQVMEWFQYGYIVEGDPDCRWNSPLLGVKKQGDPDPNKLRICLACVGVNKVTKHRGDTVLPNVMEMLEKSQGRERFSIWDCEHFYHQIPIKESDQEKTAFRWFGRVWYFCRAPFGFRWLPLHVEEMMMRKLYPFGCQPFLDDLFLATTDAEHEARGLKVLEFLTYNGGLRLKWSKCQMNKTEVILLGKKITRNGIEMDPKKVKAIKAWPRPIDGKGIQRFLGVLNFNREFSDKFAKISAPLDELRLVEGKIDWTEEQIAAFEGVKELFAEDLSLRHFDNSKEVYVTTDASLKGLGAWIGQKDDSEEVRPVLCASKKLSPTQQRYSAHKRELLALKWGINKFRHYLLGRKFIARVDHRPLIYLMKNERSRLIDGWMDLLMSYHFITEYLPGENNVIADMLSRSFDTDDPEVVVRATTVLDEVDSEEAKLLWEADRRGKVVPPVEERLGIIEKIHTLGHFSVGTMYAKIEEDGYWWPGLRKQLRQFVNTCIDCLRYDVKTAGYHPAKTISADHPWDHVEIDLIGPMPESIDGFNWILDIIDVCTSYSILRALKDKSAETVAKELWKVIADFGTPKILQSDNGKEFVNSVIEALMELYGIDHRLITSYNPRTNGKVERNNKEVERGLIKVMIVAAIYWPEWLPVIQLALNTMIRSNTNTSAFVLMFGRPFNGFEDFSSAQGLYSQAEAIVQVLEKWATFHEAIIPGIREAMVEVKSKLRERMDQEHKIVEPFEPGTQVMAVNNTRGSKWEPRYEGPLTVARQGRGGAYTLLDSTGTEIPSKRTADMLVPIPASVDNSKDTQGEQVEVARILDHRQTPNGVEYRVRWKGFDSSHDDWVLDRDFQGHDVLRKYWKQRKKDNPRPVNQATPVMDIVAPRRTTETVESAAIAEVLDKKIERKGKHAKSKTWYLVRYKDPNRADTWLPNHEVPNDVIARFKTKGTPSVPPDQKRSEDGVR
jgi:hypothetical protein